MANNIQMNNQQNLNTLPGSNTIGHNGTTGPTGQTGTTGPNEVIEMIMGYQKSQILFTASSLGIYELLETGYGGMSSGTVAERLKTNPEATERLMNACVGLGLLKKHVSSNSVVLFANSPMTQQYLLRGSRMSLTPMLNKVNDLYPLWGKLSEGVKEGNSQLSAALGVPSGAFATGTGFYATPAKQFEFLQVMHTFATVDAPAVLSAIDFNKYQRVCDLGGGTGALGSEIARRNPSCHVTVCDLTHVIKNAQQFLPQNTPKNLTMQQLDFFEEKLPPADLYILSHVVHDWSEKKIDFLLNKVHRSLEAGGSILVLEKLLNQQKTGPLDALYMDLGMLLGSDGKERNSSEYQHLMKRHGFRNVETIVLPKSKFRDVILATK